MSQMKTVIADLKRLKRAIPEELLPEWPMPSARARSLADLLLAMPDGPEAQRHQMAEDVRAALLDGQPDLGGPEFDRLIRALKSVPREHFLDTATAPFAYLPTAICIDHGQTISHPQIVAAMIYAAGVGAQDRVLDVGTGSGYQAAVLGKLAAQVTSLEHIGDLVRIAAQRLAALSVSNVECLFGDARSDAWKGGPFDAILVAARSADIPQALLDRLAPGGRLVIPLGTDDTNTFLALIERDSGDRLVMTRLGPVVFVPLLGMSSSDGVEAAALVQSALNLNLTPGISD